MSSIKLLSLNIEHSKHLDSVVPFLQSQNPDVVTLLECMEYDIPRLENVLGMQSFFSPRCVYAEDKKAVEGVEGQAIFAKEFVSKDHVYYAGEYDPLYRFAEEKIANIMRIARVLSYVEFKKDSELFRIATTHFTWSVHGEPTELQKTDMQSLLAILQNLPEFVLTGDFNAPRGRETWETLAAKYKDNIPATYTTSIDAALHRAGALPYVVDGLFTTRGYAATEVKLHSGVSDHMAVTASISKV
jgi:hypothetical protein